MTLSRALIPLLLLTTALGTQAMAQTQPIALGEIVVEADGTGSEAATVRTTAGSKLAVAVTKVPQSVSVVSRQQLDQYPGAKADEVLRYTSGVNPSTYGTDADTDWLYVRGFQADQTGVLLDDLPLYQTGFGTFLVDPFMLEQVEVLKGPASVLYGGANVGGVVNFVSKRPTGERLRYTEVGINNFGNAYFGFDVGDGLADGAAAYRLTGKISGGGYQTTNARDLRGVVQGSVKLSPTADTDVTLYASYQNIDLDHTSTGFLPYVGTVVDAPGGVRIPRNLNYGDPNADVYSRQQFMIGYEIEHDINDDWSVRQNARYAAVDLTEDYVYSNGFSNLNGTLLSRDRFAHRTQAGILSIDTQLEGNVETGPLEHNLLFGVDYKNYRINPKTNYAFAGATPLDIYNPVYGLAFPTLTLTGTPTSMNQLGFYAQDQISFNNWILTLNGRYDNANTTVESAVPVTRNDGVFTGRVGLGYEFDNGLTPYASYATSFTPSLNTDLAGNLLKSETGEQWEAGVKYEPTGFDGLITASVFNITRSNVAAPDPAAPGTYVFLSAGKVQMRGAELEAAANVGDFTLKGGLTYLEAKVLETAGSPFDPIAVGKSPVQIPTLTASLGVDYTIPGGTFEGLTIGGGVRFLGESWADNANTTKVPATTLFDASLRYERDDWGVALTASNLFDTSYVASCQNLTSCGYGAGRTVTLSVHKKW
ncbi:iron complex outermembrane recepter protein [Devosia sp. YR412]|uniref:TonB-dependent siderophore receptor n=1 Tax=Devosia sp. YR412 TaxID=1881030 RepID=UPI0008B25108|nr:TonB-dependent siderophore receptor [Devosia sp. YR412]SEQ60188.1 iron complex outermembrane recepter protein [Devosia sp. YR412]